MKCEKHGGQSTICRFCDAESIDREMCRCGWMRVHHSTKKQCPISNSNGMFAGYHARNVFHPKGRE